MGEKKTKDKRIKIKVLKNSYFRSSVLYLNDLQDCKTMLARMAELVDALVSNTSGSNAVPVRSRLRVQKKKRQIFSVSSFFLIYNSPEKMEFACEAFPLVLVI
jgi:hypothetical protein